MNELSSKKHSRILAISGGKVSFTNRNQIPIVGVLWRNPYIDKFYVKYSKIDETPNNFTQILINLIEERDEFIKGQIKAVFFNNSIMAGLSLIDMNFLHKSWQVPLVFISDKFPSISKIKELSNKLEFKDEITRVLEKNPNKWSKVPNTNLYFLAVGISGIDALELIEKYQDLGFIPEPLRIAKLLATSLPNIT